MKLLNKIFTGIMCGALMSTNVMAADDCSNIKYKQAHPERCKYLDTASNTGTYLAVGGAALAAGATVFALAGGNGGSGSSGSSSRSATTSYYSRSVTPTTIKRTAVGADVSITELTSAINSGNYSTHNAQQYDDIQLAYAVARGYTGAGTTIAVFDTDLDSYRSHGAAVAAVAGDVARGATIEHQMIAYDTDNFMSYAQIGNFIRNTTNANVYNNSWNASIGADTIRTRTQLANLTDQNFVDSISYAATQKDAIFVWAAGNDGNTQSGMLSAMPNVMSELDGHFVNVVAWDSKTSQLADYSNACGVTKDYCITAPGTIYTSETGRETAHVGTSFAAPVVSSAIAIIRQAWDYLDSTTITQILFDTAADLGDAGVDEIYGHGMLDLEAATRPVGATTIQLSENTTQPLQVARVSSQIAQGIKSANPTMAFFDAYGRDFQTNLSDNISAQNRGLGFERMRGNDARAKVKFGDMEFGFYRNDMLSGTGFMATDGETTTTYIATNKSYNLGDIELFGRTQLGVARPRVSSESIISEFSDVYTASAYIGVRGTDWSFSVGMPDTIVNGNMKLHLATGRNSRGAITYSDVNVDMAGKPAVEYTANWHNLTAGYVDNPYGTDEFYIFAKTKFAF